MKNLNLNELSLDNIGEWPLVIKMSTIAIISALTIFLGYWFFVKETLEDYETLKAQTDSLKKEFETKQTQASNLDAYRHQMNQMQERFGTMLKQLPSQNEMPSLLEDISKIGVAGGLTFISFEPQAEVAHDFYIEVPIEITVTGDYHQLALFISHVAEMNRIVTLHDFQIDEDKTNGKILTMKLTAKIYRYRTK